MLCHSHNCWAKRCLRVHNGNRPTALPATTQARISIKQGSKSGEQVAWLLQSLSVGGACRLHGPLVLSVQVARFSLGTGVVEWWNVAFEGLRTLAEKDYLGAERFFDVRASKRWSRRTLWLQLAHTASADFSSKGPIPLGLKPAPRGDLYLIKSAICTVRGYGSCKM